MPPRLTFQEITQHLPAFKDVFGQLPIGEGGVCHVYAFASTDDPETCRGVIGTFNAQGDALFLAAVQLPTANQEAKTATFEERGMVHCDMLPDVDMIAREKEARERQCTVEETIPEAHADRSSGR